MIVVAARDVGKSLRRTVAPGPEVVTTPFCGTELNLLIFEKLEGVAGIFSGSVGT